MAIPVFDLSQVTGIRKNSTTPPLISTRAGLIDGTRPGGGVGDPDPTPSGLVVSDDFETADKTESGVGGVFSWDSGYRVDIITDTPTPKAVRRYNQDVDIALPTGDWTPHSGSYCLDFRYPAVGTASGDDLQFIEQKWAKTQADLEQWMGFWLRVPENFSWSGGQTKLLAMWMDAYSQFGDGSTIWMDYDGSGNLRTSNSDGRNNTSNAYSPPVQVFDPIEDRGRWMRLVVRAVAETSPDADDGIVQIWHKWDGDASYTQLFNVSGLRLRVPTSGPNGWSAGYLMGWANGGYEEETHWLLDDFMLSTTTLIEA